MYSDTSVLRPVSCIRPLEDSFLGIWAQLSCPIRRTLGLQSFRRYAILHPIDQGVESAGWIAADPAITMHHSRGRKETVEVVNMWVESSYCIVIASGVSKGNDFVSLERSN